MAKFSAAKWLIKGRESGQTLVEYVLIIGLVAILLVTALIVLKDHVAVLYSSINSSLAAA